MEGDGFNVFFTIKKVKGTGLMKKENKAWRFEEAREWLYMITAKSLMFTGASISAFVSKTPETTYTPAFIKQTPKCGNEKRR